METGSASRTIALGTIKKALDYELNVTRKVGNPFGYARQNFLYNGAIREGFFIPQTNESGWWWQGQRGGQRPHSGFQLPGGEERAQFIPADGPA